MIYLRQFFLITFQISLVGLVAIVTLIVVAPKVLDNASPYRQPGPALATLVGDHAEGGSFHNYWETRPKWPAWATATDRDNILRTNATLQRLEISNFNYARTSVTKDIKSRGNDPGDLYRVILYFLLGGKDAIKYTGYLIIFSLFGAVYLGITGKIAHNIWINPFYSGEGVRRTLTLAGRNLAITLVMSIIFFCALLVGGLVIRTHSGIFFGLTEYFIWLSIFSLIYWPLSIITAPGVLADILQKKSGPKTVTGRKSSYKARDTEQPHQTIEDLGVEMLSADDLDKDDN